MLHRVRVESFDPATLSLLVHVFDVIWSDVEAKTSTANRLSVREAIAVGIMKFAKDGHTERAELLSLGRDLALSTLKAQTSNKASEAIERFVNEGGITRAGELSRRKRSRSSNRLAKSTVEISTGATEVRGLRRGE